MTAEAQAAATAAEPAALPRAAPIVVRNPATGERVGEVERATAAEVAAAVGRARAAQRDWEARGWRERAAVVGRFHDLILRRADPILDVIQNESGKARKDALTELLTVAGTARYYLAHGRRHLRDRRARPAVLGVTWARVVYKPHGVVGLITPWNYPFLLAIGDAVPALLAGNAVVVKPAALTPLSAVAAREAMLACGLPPDVLQLVHGPGSELGQELVRHVDYVGFTGGTEAGRQVAVAAAQRLVPYSLELGGKNPMIVLADAPVDDTVTGLVAGAFTNSGQTCISIERVYVEDAIYDRFVAAAAARAARLRLGWSRRYDVDMGSLISAEHAAKVEAHVADAVAKGARVLAGGVRRRDLGEAFVAPTLLADVRPDMRVSREETFGPVVSVQRVRDADEAVRLANDSEYGLNASVWGRGSHPWRVARRLETGSTGINSTLLIYASFDVPMGGVKASGVGRRHGAEGIRRYTEAQSLVRSIPTAGGYEAVVVHADSRRFAGALLAAFRWWRHIPGLR